MRAFLPLILAFALPALAADLRCEITATGAGRPASCRIGLDPVEPELGERAAVIPLFQGSTRVTCPELHLWSSISIDDDVLTLLVADDGGHVLGQLTRPMADVPELGRERPLEIFAGSSALWLGAVTLSCGRPQPTPMPEVVKPPNLELPLADAQPVAPPGEAVAPPPVDTPTVPSPRVVEPAAPVVVEIARAPKRTVARHPVVTKPAPAKPAAKAKPKPKPRVKRQPLEQPIYDGQDGQPLNAHDIY